MVHFGTGGWRAIIGDEFIKDNVVKVAQGLSDLMKTENVHQKGIVIGYDKRFLSDKSAKWLAEVFAGNGIAVNFVAKDAPTPLIMYAVKKLDTDYGMAVTASHNPADYNGIKVFTKGGKDADLDVTEKIEANLINMSLEDVKVTPFQEAVDLGIIRIINPMNDYVDTIISMLDVESIRNKELKILLDPMFGVSKTALQTILLTARCEVDVIHDRHDTMFGGRLPSPSENTLTQLIHMVVEKGYDLGIGTDGDADRLGIIDEKGNFIHPNKIMALLYYYLLKYKNWRGPVVRNIATTHLLDAIAAKYGETCYEVPVGFKWISGKMNETGAVIGGESSGGLTIKGHIKGKDGIFAAGLLVEMISVTGLRLAQMLTTLEEEFGCFEMAEANIAFTQQVKERVMRELYDDKAMATFDVGITKISHLDGVKVYLEDGGWIIARFSGTEPLIRIFAERSSMALAEQTIETLKKFLDI